MRFSQLFAPRDVSRIGALRFVARQAVEGLAAGRHRSPHHGSSVEFKEHRPYVPGDDVGAIDWKAFGKSDRLYLRRFEEETDLRCTLMVDRSASMRYGGSRSIRLGDGGPATKQQYASALAAAIAYLLLSQQDAVGLWTFHSMLRDVLPCRSRGTQLQAILSALAEESAQGATDWDVVLRQAMAKLPRRGVVVLITDAMGEPEPLGRLLASLRAAHQEIVFFQIVDPDEADFPFAGRVEFRDLEDAGSSETLDARQIRAAYLKAFDEHTDAIRDLCRKHRVDHAVWTTDTPLVDALAKFIGLRRGQPVVGSADRVVPGRSDNEGGPGMSARPGARSRVKS